MAATLRAFAQGQIWFNNRVPGVVDAPVFEADCLTPLAGAAYLAQGYVGLTMDNLSPAGNIFPFRDGAAAGYINTGVADDIITVEAGGLVYFQMRAWKASAGATFEAAVASGGPYGASEIFLVDAEYPPGPPEPLRDLESFCLVPEPAPILLFALGTLLLLAQNPKRTLTRFY